MADKIDQIKIGNTSWDIDLPPDAAPSIASITTSGNATIGGTISEGGTTLANKYLGKTAKAADADKLDGNDSTYYLNYNNLSNKPTIPTIETDSDVSEERISVPSTMKILKVMVPISWNAGGDGGTDVDLYIHFSNGGANYINVQATSTGREIHYCSYKEFEITKGYQNSSGRYYLVKVTEHDDEETIDQISTYSLYTTGYIDQFYIDPNLAKNTFDDDQVQVYYQIFE